MGKRSSIGGEFFSCFVILTLIINFIFTGGAWAQDIPSLTAHGAKSETGKAVDRFSRRSAATIFFQSDETLKDLEALRHPEEKSIYFDLVREEFLKNPAQALQDMNLAYFANPTRVIEPESGYPREGLNQLSFTQPTNIGFYAQLLANIVSGDIQTKHISSLEARHRLYRLTASLLRDQKELGFRGLLPWISYRGKMWKRDGGPYGRQVMFGDNSNLSASIGASIGALMHPSLAGDPQTQRIIHGLEQFLENQRSGYEFLFDPARGQFRRGWSVAKTSWVEGHHDYFADEFRSGILFVMLRYDFPRDVFSKLELRMRRYQTFEGREIYSLVPYCGGAFQMFWPTLTSPETDLPGAQAMHENFLDAALDFSKRENLPGLLSASYTVICGSRNCRNEYAPNAGMEALAMNAEPRNERVASLYTLGPAYSLQPEKVETFLKSIFKRHPDLVNAHGLWEGFNIESERVVEEQIVSNVATFSIGLAGRGPLHMRRYLKSRGLYAAFLTLFQEGMPTDLLAKSDRISSWGGTGFKKEESYEFRSDKRGSMGIAFSFKKPVNLSGRTFKLTYQSNREFQNAKLELKHRGKRTTSSILIAEKIHFQETRGKNKTIIISLPVTPGLSEISEAVFVIDTAEVPLTLEIEKIRTI